MKTSDWNNPKQSSEDMGREKLRKDSSGLGYSKGRDVSKKADQAAEVNSGFSGKLPKA
jgi:hypothetical protein